MSELQGPRIPGEERTGRRRPVAWIIGGLFALLLLALLIPFACQALGGAGSDPQSGGSGAQEEEKTSAQGTDDAQGAGGEQGAAAGADASGGKTTAGAGEAAGGGGAAGANKETTRAKATQAGAPQKREANTGASRSPGGEKVSGEGAADVRDIERLPASGGTSPASLLTAGGAFLVVSALGLLALMRRLVA